MLFRSKADYATFEDYCRERWGLTRRHVNRQIAAASVVSNLGPIGPKLPQTESQARPLSQLDPDQQRAAWAEAVETAPGGKITAAHVQTVVNGYNGKAMKPKENKAGDIYEPKGYDACQTPPYAVEPLLPYLSRFDIIWEPAAGEGHLANALATLGRSIITSDILTGENFFSHEPPEWDALITNPPYSIKYEWMSRCYDLGKPFALLLPIETLGAVQAQMQFKRHDVSVMFLSSRVNFKMPSHDRFGMGAAQDRKSTRLNSSHSQQSRMPSSA